LAGREQRLVVWGGRVKTDLEVTDAHDVNVANLLGEAHLLWKTTARE